MREKWLRMEEAMEREVKGRKAGVLFSAALCALCLLLSLPFVSWIRLVNISALFSRMGITREMAAELYQSYGIFNLLSFVEKGKQGALGLYAMICLLLLLAVWYFQLSYLWRVLRNKKHKNGNLGLYVCGRAATVLAILLAAASQGFVFFANATYGMKGFLSSPVIYLVAALSALAYGMIKRMEKRERLLYHEHGLLKELRKNWVLFLMLVPTFVYFLINSYLPMVGVYYAFTNFNFRDGLWASPFVGFKNFEFLFKGDLVRLIRNTVLYNVAFILLGNLTQIFFAILVSQVLGKWFKKITQTLMFMPYFVSYVLLKVLVYNMFEYDYGVINSLITAWGGTKIDFYNTPAYWPMLIILFNLWKGVGYGMVVYLASIMGIDGELYEAARVDGANVFQQIRYITMPLLKPTFIILLLYSLGGIMRGQFELFYQMVGTNGILYRVTDIIDTYVYRITMTQPLSIGLGTAAGLYQSVFGLVVVVATNWLIKRKNEQYALF